MGVQQPDAQRLAPSRVARQLTWLGGGHWRELDEPHERSTHAVTGVVVLFSAALAWLVATLAMAESMRWPGFAVATLALVFALLVGAVTRGTTTGPRCGWPGVAGRTAIGAALGVIVGDLAALVMLSASIGDRLDERALRTADWAPAVAQASASLQQTRDTRNALDGAVEQARERRDKALVIARCEYHPSPGCPQTKITGVPGSGPETRTAQKLLADAQHELDNALAARDRQAPVLDATISRERQALTRARHSVVADAGRGLGDRWAAMNELTSANTGVLTARLLTIGCCVLLYLLPLILGRWRGETTHDRQTTARAERDRAELTADTAIAIKRAEVRREAEFMWAEHQLTQARLAIEAQSEIDREQQRRRVLEAFEGPVHASSQRTLEPSGDDIYLPIAAEAEAASRAVTPPAAEPQITGHGERGAPLILSIPGATRAAARWVRPLVPHFVARVVDTTTQPLRTARQVFEEVEEITFALKRTRKVTVQSESVETGDSPPRHSPTAPSSHEERRQRAHQRVGSRGQRSPLQRRVDSDAVALGSAEHDGTPELTKRDGPPELPSPKSPRELPPLE